MLCYSDLVILYLISKVYMHIACAYSHIPRLI
jgi:hypothetical protein